MRTLPRYTAHILLLILAALCLPPAHAARHDYRRSLPRLAVAPSSLSFGSVTVGQTRSLSATVSNTGRYSVRVSNATTNSASFLLSNLPLPITLQPGQSRTFTVSFMPASAVTMNAMLAFSVWRSRNVATLPLTGTGSTTPSPSPGSLAANPSSISFGTLPVGTTSNLTEVLTNSGGSSLTVTKATVSGTGFSISGMNLPLTLSPKQSYTFTASFKPQASTSATGSIALSSDASNPNLTIALSGAGAASGQVSVSPVSLNFGSVVVGSSQKLSGTLSASGSSMTVGSASSTSPEFILSGLSFPLTLSAGQSLPFTVTFAPQASGAASANLTFSSTGTTAAVQTLAGNGTAAPQHSVSLSWNASTSSVAGYNIYRGSVSGGPYNRLNTSPDASTTYTDNSVQSGQTYFYVTTAVDGNGVESGYSNQAQAVIP